MTRLKLLACALMAAVVASPMLAASQPATPTAPAATSPGRYPPAAVRVPKTWTDHTFKGPDGTLFHYVEQGKGTPVILIHGLTSSAVGNWFNTGVGQRLAMTNRVIALDMRGHGETGASPAGSTGTMPQDVVDLMNFLKIDKAHIGGYSMGGATTAALLKLAPDRFITASLMGIGVRETPEWQGKGPADRPVAGQAPLPPGRTSPTTLNTAGIPTGAPAGAPAAIQDVDLTKIKFPVLALNGGNDTPLVKTHRMWRELEDFTYVVVPDKNHMQTSSDPRFGEKLAQFIVAHNPPK